MVKTRGKRSLFLAVMVASIMLGLLSVTAEAFSTTTEYDIYIVLATSNLRAEPSREGRWVATIPENAYVMLLDKTDTDFRHVLYDGVEGYIYSGCIKKLEGDALALARETLGLTQEETEEQAFDALAVPATVAEYKNGGRVLQLLPKAKEQEAADAQQQEASDIQEQETAELAEDDAGEADSSDNNKIIEITSAAQAKSMAVTKTVSEEKSSSAGIEIISALQMRETKDSSASENESMEIEESSEESSEASSEEETETAASSETEEGNVTAAIGSLHIGSSFVGSRQKTSSSESSAESTATYEQATVLANAVLRSLPSANSSKIITVPQNGVVSILDEGENGYLHVSYEGSEGYVIAKVAQRDGTRTSASGILNTIVTEEQTTTATTSATTATSPVLASRHRNLTSSSVVLNYIQQDQEEDSLTQEEELTASAETSSTSTLTNSDIDYQIRTRANMRMTPSQGGDWITTLPTGATVDLLGETANGYTLVQYNGIQGYVLESVVVDSVDFASASAEQSALFTLTGYCSCAKCCGSYSPEITGGESHTATGTVPVEGRTIAVDPKVIPYGSIVHIDGLGDYVAEDCGGSINGNQIDVYFESHEAALQFGRQKRYVSVE